MAEIKHKWILVAFAALLTLYAGGKFGASPRSSPPAPDASPLSDAPSDDEDASAESPLAVTAFAHTPSNVTLDVAWSAGTVPSNSILRVWHRHEAFTNDWCVFSDEPVPTDVTNLTLVLSTPATNAAFYTVSVIGDADGDTLDDFFERQVLHTDPGCADTDGDGFSDPFEYAHGLPPTLGCDRVATNAPGVVSYALADPFSLTDPDAVGSTVFSRTFPVGRATPWRQFFVVASPVNTMLAPGLSGRCYDSAGVTNSLAELFSEGSMRLVLSTNAFTSITFEFDAVSARFGLSAPIELVAFEPLVSFPDLPFHVNDDGTRTYVATNASSITVGVDRSNRPLPYSVSEEELRANPFYDDPRFDWDWGECVRAPTVTLPGVGEYPLRCGDRLLVLAPSVTYGTPHGYVGDTVTHDPEAETVRFTRAYPLDSVTLWEGWHEGTNVVGSSVCSCRPEFMSGIDLSPYPFLESALESDGESATGNLRLDGRVIWTGTAHHDRFGSVDGRSDCLSDDGCGCSSGCEDGDCDALEGPSLGSIRFRIPLGSPRAGQVAGFLWFESDTPFTPDYRSFALLARPDAGVTDVTHNNARNVEFSGPRGRRVTLTDLPDGVSATVRFPGTDEVDHVWRITREGGAMRFVKLSRLGNVMSNESFASVSNVWTRTDNVTGVTESEATRDYGLASYGELERERTVVCDGRVAERTVTVSVLIGSGSDAVVREVARRELAAYGEWRESYAVYWDDPSNPRRHGALRYEYGADRDWRWLDYDDEGREIFTLEQRNGSEPPGDDYYSFDSLPSCDAFATVLDYTPLAGDSEDENDSETPRVVSRYAVSDGSPTLIARTWTRIERGVFAAEYPRADSWPLVRTTTVRASSQAASVDDSANAVSVAVVYSSDSPLVPYALRGRVIASTDEDGVTERTAYTSVSNALRAVTRRLKGAAEAKTRRVTEEDPAFGHVLYEATQLTAEPSVEFGWRRMLYDEKGRLRSVRYDDGSSETNEYSCCRLLSRTDRTGAKTLRSATTGTDRLYYAEEVVSLRELPKDAGLMPSGLPSGLAYNEGFPVRRHYLDGLGRETNVVSGVERVVGIATNRSWVATYWPRAESRTRYPEGSSDVVESVDERGLVTRLARLPSQEVEISVSVELEDGRELSSVTNIGFRGGGSVSVRTADGFVTRTSSFDEYGPDGCRTSVDVTDASDLPQVTNSVVRYDFLGRTVRSTSPNSDVESFYEGSSPTERWSRDMRSGVSVTNIVNEAGETVGSVTRGVTTRADESYLFRSNVWWRVSTETVSAGAVTNAVRVTEARLTGLSDEVRAEELVYEDGAFVSSSRVSFDPVAHDETTTVRTAKNGVSSRTVRYGHETESMTPAETYTTYYDNYGRRFTMRRPLMGVETYSRYRAFGWSAAGDLLEEDEYCFAAGTSSTTRWKGRSYGYDRRGNRVVETNEVGNVVRRAYSDSGLLVSEDGDTYPVRFGYDSAGRRTSLLTTRDGGVYDETRWTYDPVTGACTAKVYADGSRVSYTYADDGHPLRTTFQSGDWIECVYDADRRPVGQVSGDARCTFALEPDAFGRTVAASNGVARFGFGLANCGVATNETATVGGVAALIGRTVDGCGRMTSLSVDGADAAYAYNPTNGVLESVSNADCVVRYVYSRDLQDMGYGLELANGLVFRRTLLRDSRQRNEVEMVRNVCDARTNSVSYAYDFLSRPVTRGGDTFAYNRRGEVAQATIAGQTESHVYDLIGNSVMSAVSSADSSFVATTNVYAANNLNQYETIQSRENGSLQTEALSYDANGDLASGGDFVYSYDALSRLTFAYNVWSGSSISNEYDHLSRRIRKVAPDGNHVYFYDGWNLVLELIHRSDNTTDRIEYYWGKDLSGSLQGAGGIGGLLYLKYNGAIYIPFYDAYGNILGYWNAAGDVVASYTYDAFGKTISSTGPLADVFNFRYSTKYFDSETELYYYGYRYYSPELRRWITRDPIEEDGGVNLYAMGRNALSLIVDVDGCRWVIARKGGAYAEAYVTSSCDTFRDLARLLRLDFEDYRKWALTQDVLPLMCKIYKVPNTIVYCHGGLRVLDGLGAGFPVDLYGHRVGFFYDVFAYWESVCDRESRNMSGAGFKVVNLAVSGSDLESAFKTPGIYQLTYVGHGTTGMLAPTPSGRFELGDASAKFLSSARYTDYGINRLVLRACNSYSVGWAMNVARAGYFLGYLGTININNEQGSRAVRSGLNVDRRK